MVPRTQGALVPSILTMAPLTMAPLTVALLPWLHPPWLHPRQVLKYHGSEAERAEMRGDILGGSFHVVLCTFKLWEQESNSRRVAP